MPSESRSASFSSVSLRMRSRPPSAYSFCGEEKRVLRRSGFALTRTTVPPSSSAPMSMGGRRRLVGRNVAFHLVRRFAVEIAAEQEVSAGTVFGGLSGGVRVRTACKEQLRSLLLKGKLFGVFLSGGLLLLLERRLGCFGLCLPGGRRFRLRRLARCTRGKAECQQQRKSKVFSYSHDRSSS